MSAARLIVGNLDCELSYAPPRPDQVSGPPGPRRELPAPVGDLAAALATLLRVFAREGDRLWTPRAVDPARVPAARELPDVQLESGSLRDAEPPSDVLAWGETRETAELRKAWHLAPRSAPRGAGGGGGAAPLWDALWSLPAPEPDAAAQANHRGFSFELSRSLGCALPGARRIRAREELEAHLLAGGADAGRGAWVAKAPLGAAGRERAGQRGGSLRGDVRVRVERLLAEHGELIFEPWVSRTSDYGVCGFAGAPDAEPAILEPHRLECDRQGVIRALEVGGRAGALAEPLRRELTSAARVAGAALARAGYRGPFNVDAFTYEDPSGAARVQPLCEINARLSLGFVARALAERVAAPRGYSGARLELGRPALGDPAGAARVPLLTPGGAHAAAAALVLRP